MTADYYRCRAKLELIEDEVLLLSIEVSSEIYWGLPQVTLLTNKA